MNLEDAAPDAYECPTCGKSYQRPARHWEAGNDCEWPEIDETLRAHLDAIATAGGSADGKKNTRLRVWTTSRERAIWIAQALGWLVRGVDRRETDDRTQYAVKTMSHPDLEEYLRWSNGVPPDRVSWSRPFGRVWYALAGGLQDPRDRVIPSIHIGERVDERRRQRLATLLEGGGYDVSVGQQTVIVAPRAAQRLLRDLGPPLPGTAYKWIYDVDLRREARERALDGEPLIQVGDDPPTIARSLVSFVAERRDLPDVDAWDRLVAAPAGQDIAEFFGGGDWDDALRVIGPFTTSSQSDTTRSRVSGEVDEGEVLDQISTQMDRNTSGYSVEDCMDALEEASVVFEGALSSSAYAEWRVSVDKRVPSTSTIRRVFGDWKTALDVAGLEDRIAARGPRSEDARNSTVSKQEAIEALQRAAEALGSSFTSAEYKAWSGPDDPAVSTISRKWGWSDTLEEAGVSPSKSYDHSEDDAIQAVIDIRQSTDEWPSADDYREHKEPEHPAVQTIYDLFDGWPDLIERAKAEFDD